MSRISISASCTSKYSIRFSCRKAGGKAAIISGLPNHSLTSVVVIALHSFSVMVCLHFLKPSITINEADLFIHRSGSPVVPHRQRCLCQKFIRTLLLLPPDNKRRVGVL